MGRAAGRREPVSGLKQTDWHSQDVMENDRDKQIEQLIHRELRQLPELRAPETLVHRVMLAVHAKARQSWWHRPWLTWPFGMQLLSLALLLVSVGLISYLAGAAWGGLNLASLSGRIVESFAWLKPIQETVSALAGAVGVLLRVVGQQFLLIGTVLVIMAYLACVGLGTVCFRLAYNKA